jgi:CBS domain-containing protein
MGEHDLDLTLAEVGSAAALAHDAHVPQLGKAQEDFDARRATARDVMTAEIHCCREDEDLAKAVRQELKVRRLPVIKKSKRMIGMLSLGDVGHSAPVDLLSGTRCCH